MEQMQQELEELRQQISRLSTSVTARNVADGNQPIPMNALVPLPKPINLKDPDFVIFKEAWKNYVVAAQLDKRSEAERAAILLTAIGEDCFRIIQNLKLSEDKKKNCKEILKELERNLVPETNVIYSRVKFNEAKQNIDEPAEIYIDRLRGLIKQCKYGEMENELLRDRLVISTKYYELRTKFMTNTQLTLESVIQDIKAHEAAQNQLRLIKTNEEERYVINRIGHKRSRSRNNISRQHERSTNRKQAQSVCRICKYCGYKHTRDQRSCPAYGKKCNKCNKANHFANVCMSSRENKRSVQEIQFNKNKAEKVERAEENLFKMEDIHSIEEPSKKKIYTDICGVKGNGEKFTFQCQIDTGATVNVIGLRNLWEILGKKPKLEKTDVEIKTFGNYVVKPIGKYTIRVLSNDNKYYELIFQVMEFDHIPMLSNATCLRLNVISVNTSEVDEIKEKNANSNAERIIDEFKDVFTGLGKIDYTVTLATKKDIKPNIETPRRVPIAYREEVKKMLQQLDDEDIITKVEEHSPWVSNMLIVKRNNKLRLCLDPVKLNQALEREEYPTKTIDEILPELKQAKVFSTFDAKQGFWQLTLDEESSKLTTFWTPFGRYRWKRVPFGIAPAPEIFQKVIYEIIANLENVEAIADDILVYGKGETLEEAINNHDKCLRELLQKLRKVNLKLNPEKSKILQTSIKYYGHILTDQGVKPDDAKVEAIDSMPTPRNKKELTTFLGMITYLARYLPKLSSISKPLRELTKEDTDFVWTKKHDTIYLNLKNAIKKAPVLAYFDVDKPAIIQCDASDYGLGAVLIQNEKPVMYASRTMTPTETKYSQIEKEALAILFACNRFRQYISGKRTTVHSDHKPLEVIWKKPLIKAPKRLQRILLNLSPYDITIKHIPGKEMQLSDTLSRFPNTLVSKDEDDIDNTYIYEIESVNPEETIEISEQVLEEIREEMTKDDVMKTLIQYIKEGWPVSRKTIKNEELKTFFNFRDELAEHDGLVLKENRIVIPKNLRNRIAMKLHRAHAGESYTLQFARRTVYWPHISQDVRQVCKQCAICRKYESNPKKLPMQSTEIPEYPGELYSMDIFEIEEKGKRQNYLLVVDHYSDFFEIARLENMRSENIIANLKKIFARFGSPRRLICDNAKQFISREILDFARKWKFEISCSSPIHSQGNGKAEITVKAAKQLLYKSVESGEDFYLMLLQSRNTPNHTNLSPVERMLCRATRVPDIPMRKKSFMNKTCNYVKMQISRNKRKTKGWYDKNTSKLPRLEIGTPVYVRLNKNQQRQPGIISNSIKDRSYNIRTNKGEYRRNRTDIIPITVEDRYSLIEERANPHSSHKHVGFTEPATWDIIHHENRSQQHNREENRNNSDGQQVEDEQHQEDQQPDEQMESQIDEEQNSNQPQENITRSGRVSRRPLHLQDYEVYSFKPILKKRGCCEIKAFKSIM